MDFVDPRPRRGVGLVEGISVVIVRLVVGALTMGLCIALGVNTAVSLIVLVLVAIALEALINS